MKKEFFNELVSELNRFKAVFVPKVVIPYFVNDCQKYGIIINGGAFKFNDNGEFVGQYFYN